MVGDNDVNLIVVVIIMVGSKMVMDILDMFVLVLVIMVKDMQVCGVNIVEQVLCYIVGVVMDFYGGDDCFDYYKICGFDVLVFCDGLLM